jgi:hypothetical protein
MWGISRGYFPFEPRRPGGDATTEDAALLRSSGRFLTNAVTGTLLSAPYVFDTGTMAWGSTATGSAALVSNPASKRLQTGSTAGSGIAAFVNENNTPIGPNQGNVNTSLLGFGASVKVPSAVSADYEAFFGVRAAAWNAGFTGALTGGGSGFRIINGIVEGVSWGNGALIVSAESRALITGAAGWWSRLQVVITPQTINAARGELEWFVNGERIGGALFDHANMRPPRFELTNGAAAANYILDFSPARVVSVGL